MFSTNINNVQYIERWTFIWRMYNNVIDFYKHVISSYFLMYRKLVDQLCFVTIWFATSWTILEFHGALCSLAEMSSLQQNWSFEWWNHVESWNHTVGSQSWVDVVFFELFWGPIESLPAFISCRNQCYHVSFCRILLVDLVGSWFKCVCKWMGDERLLPLINPIHAYRLDIDI